MAQRIVDGEQYESFLIRGGIDGGPVPVVFASGITISGVTLGAEVEVTNNSGNPLPVSGPLTDTQLRAAAVPVSPNVQQGAGVVTATTTRVTLANDGPGVANLSSIAGLSIPAHDYIALTYTGTNLSGVQYRTGGASGTIVGTLTLAYSGSNLISVTKS